MAGPGGATPMPGVDRSLDHQNRSIVLYVLTAVFLFFSLLLGGGRLYTRGYLLRNFGADDATSAASLFLLVAYDALLIATAILGTGRHVWTLTPQQVHGAYLTLFICPYFYLCSLNCTKISLLLQYRRVFGRTWLKSASALGIAFLAVECIAQLILVTLGCIPLSLMVPSMASKCVSMRVVWNMVAALNIVTDFVICILPIRLVKTLKLREKQKTVLSVTFGLGFCACFISLLKVYFMHIARPADPTWAAAMPITWSMLEANIAFCCSCIPTLRPLVAAALPGLRERSRSLLGSRLSTKTMATTTTTTTATTTTAITTPPHQSLGRVPADNDYRHSRKESNSSSNSNSSNTTTTTTKTTAYTRTSDWAVAKSELITRTTTTASDHTQPPPPPSLHETDVVLARPRPSMPRFSSAYTPGRRLSYAPPIAPHDPAAGGGGSGSAQDRASARWSRETEAQRLGNQVAAVSAWVSTGAEQEDEAPLPLPSKARTRSDDSAAAAARVDGQLCMVEHVISNGDSSRHIVIIRSTSPAN